MGLGRKTLAIFLVILMVLSSSIENVKGSTDEPTMYINPLWSFAGIGEYFNVTMEIKNALDVYAWQVNLTFDSGTLEMVGAWEGGFLKDQPEGTYFLWWQVKEGSILVACSTLGIYPGVDGSGTLATVEFQVLAEGESVLNITNPNTALFKMNPPPVPPGVEPMEEIPSLKKNGYFTNLVCPPLPSFTWSPSIPTTEDVVTFNSSASYDLDGSIIQFVWDFGDGTMGTGVIAFHTYSEAGQYLVSLTATDDSSLSNVICRTLTVRPYTTGPVHNIDTGLNYATIQEAIDADETEDGHTIFVDSGVYHENVRVTKSLKLIGEDSFTTIIDGEGGRVLSIFGDPLHPLKNVTVKGFTMMNGSLGIFVGMMWDPQTNTWGRANIIDNIVKDNIAGIIVDSGRKNVLKNNDMSDNIYNLCLRAREEQDIDTTNTINGKPVYYLINRSNLLIDPTTFPNIGYLALVNCTNVTVRNLILSENGQGILLGESRNITLFNNEITNNVYGVDASAINQSQFIRNTIHNNGLGMMLRIGNFNNITKNKFENNTSLNVPSDAPIEFRIRLREGFGGDSGALSLLGVTSSTIIGNTIKNNDEGIDLGRCSGNTLRNNVMTANTLNFGVNPYVSKFSYFVNDIDASNTVNGKPIIWWTNQHNKQVPLDAGYVAVINSTNISIKNLNVSNNRQGILIVSSNNTMISGNTISNVAYGIAIYRSYKQIPGPIHDSINSTVFNNTVTASGTGILLRSGWNHTVSFNSLSNNLAGIVVRGGAFQTMILGNTVMNSTYPGPYNVPHESWWWEITAYGSTGIIIESPLNIIRGNTMAYNDIGMAVGLATMIGNNVIYHNNFIDNLYQQLWTGPSNILDNGYPSGGNYWSDHVTVDDYRGINQDELGSDGIVDEPYIIDANNRDNYPLVEPWTPLPRTIDELKTKVEEFGLEGEIGNQGIVRSLIAKLSVAQKLVDKGKIDEAKSILEEDFIPQVQNLSEIRITAEAAELLVKSAEYILSHL